jgi:hypothetical protein
LRASVGPTTHLRRTLAARHHFVRVTVHASKVTSVETHRVAKGLPGCFLRSDRRAQRGSPMRRSITPTRTASTALARTIALSTAVGMAHGGWV